MKVLVTRSEPGATGFCAKLRDLSIESICEPLLIANLKTDYSLDLEKIGAVAVTSNHGVAALLKHPEISSLRSLPVFAVGEATAQQARDAGWDEVYSADGDVEALGDYVMRKRSGFSGDILYATTAKRSGNLEGKLARAGIGIETVLSYDVGEVDRFSASTHSSFVKDEIDAVCFHSTRAADVFARLIEKCDLYQRLKKITALSLSEPVAGPLKVLGFGRLCVAKKPNDPALLELLETIPLMTEKLSDG